MGVCPCVCVRVAGTGGWSTAVPSILAQLHFQCDLLHFPSSSGPGSAPSLPTFHQAVCSAPHSGNTNLLVSSRTSTFFRSSKFSVEQDSTLQSGEKEDNCFFSVEQTLSQELREREVGIRERRQGISCSREVRAKAWPNLSQEEG